MAAFSIERRVLSVFYRANSLDRVESLGHKLPVFSTPLVSYLENFNRAPRHSPRVENERHRRSAVPQSEGRTAVSSAPAVTRELRVVSNSPVVPPALGIDGPRVSSTAGGVDLEVSQTPTSSVAVVVVGSAIPRRIRRQSASISASETALSGGAFPDDAGSSAVDDTGSCPRVDTESRLGVEHWSRSRRTTV